MLVFIVGNIVNQAPHGMKKLIIILAAIYLLLGIIFYIQDLRYSRLRVRIEAESQKVELTKELPTTFYMIFLWPFLIAGQALSQ